MTTLPTTTPIRLPRPAGATPLALPAGGAGPSPVSGAMTGADAWRVIRTNIWWIFLAVVVTGAIGYGVNWYLLKNYSSYTATGFTQVNPPVNFNILQGTGAVADMSGLPIDQRTQAQLMQQEA